MEKVKIVPARSNLLEYDCLKLLSNQLVSASEFRSLCSMINSKDEESVELAKQLIRCCALRQPVIKW